MPEWLVILIVTLVGGWALDRFVDAGLAAIWVIVGLVMVLAVLWRGRTAA